MGCRYWSEYEEAWLRQVWPITEISAKVIAHALKRTRWAVKQRAYELRIRRPWIGSPEHLELLRKLYSSPKHTEQLKQLHKIWSNSSENKEQLKRAGRKGTKKCLKKAQETWIGSPGHVEQLKRLHKTWNSSPKNMENLKNMLKKTCLANPSKPELEVKAIIDKWNINYLQHEPIGTGGKFHPDFLLPDHNTIIEVDGCYWHECEECGLKLPSKQRIGTNGRAWTKARNAYFRKCGYNLIIVREHEKKNGYPTLMSFLEGFK